LPNNQRTGLKTTALEIEGYPTDFLMIENISEITSVILKTQAARSGTGSKLRNFLGSEAFIGREP
jgi:hypothetical protein